MKIAMVGQFPPHVGGVGVHIHTLSKELVKQGHEAVSYTHLYIFLLSTGHITRCLW